MEIKNHNNKNSDIFAIHIYICSKMLSSSQDKFLMVSTKTTSPKKLFAYDCVTL